MNISATFNGEQVNIVDIDVNGCSVYVTYKDAVDNLKVYRSYFDTSTSGSNIIATSAIIVS